MYYDELSEMRDTIKGAIKTLRKSYRSGEKVCVTDYSDEEIRKAYMIAYYPYFFLAAEEIVKDIFNGIEQDNQKLSFTYFACGPCPELYGTVRALKDIADKNSLKNISVEVNAFDLQKGWFDPYFLITIEMCRELLTVKPKFYTGFDISKSVDDFKKLNIGKNLTSVGLEIKNRLQNTNIVFLQNYLSHISDDDASVNNFLSWLKNLAALLENGTFLTIIDLEYGATRKVFEEITRSSFLDESSLIFLENISHTPADGDTLTITHPLTSYGIRKNIFEKDSDNLQLRCNTNYYKLILQKVPF